MESAFDWSDVSRVALLERDGARVRIPTGPVDGVIDGLLGGLIPIGP